MTTISVQPYRLDIHHRRWSLHFARVAITMNMIAAASYLTLNGAPALLPSHGVKTCLPGRRRA
jgi:hypothetical protein